MEKKQNPWLWIPTLYFAEGIPYFIVNVISVIMFKNLGMNNADVALYTGLLYLPWVIKPLWSPFVDIIRTKRWWILLTQAVAALSFALVALTIPRQMSSSSAFIPALVIFWVTGFASATHDIAADGFYMLALNQREQSFFVGIRSTFYRLSSVFGQGIIVVLAGLLEKRLGDVPLAWRITLTGCSVLFGAIALWHTFSLPRPSSDRGSSDLTVNGIIRDFVRTFVTFFRKRGVVIAMLFMLLYRLPEAFLVKMLNPFLLDPLTEGGLALDTEMVGIVYGTVGVLALTLGGILGGMATARWGLRKLMWPMSLSLVLPCLVFVYLSFAQPSSLLTVNLCVALDQFGYGFGFTAYMLYMMRFSEGEYKTAHYSLCTAFMALSMMLPGMVAGYLQTALGYRGFFLMVIACCLATFAVTLAAMRTSFVRDESGSGTDSPNA